jgi:hypothetical protein
MLSAAQSNAHGVILRVSIDGVPAAPLAYINGVIQSGGLVWVR